MKKLVLIIIILSAAIAGYLILSKKPAQKPVPDSKDTTIPDFDSNDYLDDAISDLESVDAL